MARGWQRLSSSTWNCQNLWDAERKGWTVSPEHIYSDDGISGAIFDAGRPGLARLVRRRDDSGLPRRRLHRPASLQESLDTI